MAGGLGSTVETYGAALTGGRVIDGTGREPITNATLLIEKGRIAAVGPAAAVRIPAGATRVPLAGKTVIPGLINVHGHVQVQASELRFARLCCAA